MTFTVFKAGQNGVIDGTNPMPFNGKERKLWRIAKFASLVATNKDKPLTNSEIAKHVGFISDAGFIALRNSEEFQEYFAFHSIPDSFGYVYELKEDAPEIKPLSSYDSFAEGSKITNRKKLLRYRINKLKELVRSLPAGTKINNAEIAKLWNVSQQTVILVRSKKEFQKEFVISDSYGGLGYIYTIKEDANLKSTFTPTYVPPVYDKDEQNKVVDAAITLGQEIEKAKLDEPLVDSKAEFFELAKQAAVDKMARALTVGEVMDYAERSK